MTDILDYIKSVLYAKSIKKILNVYINNAMFLIIEFNNSIVSHKINKDLKTFLNITQHFNVKKVSKEKKYCKLVPVNFYDIFGITEGDIIELSGANEDADFTMNLAFQSVPNE